MLWDLAVAAVGNLAGGMDPPSSWIILPVHEVAKLAINILSAMAATRGSSGDKMECGSSSRGHTLRCKACRLRATYMCSGHPLVHGFGVRELLGFATVASRIADVGAAL